MTKTLANCLKQIKKQTSGHKPGDPYVLARRQFAAFAAIVLPSREQLGNQTEEVERKERALFWAEIARQEAGRQFQDWSRSQSELRIESYSAMTWRYATSNEHPTVLCAEEWREEGHEPKFSVQIPEERDKPGRNAWIFVRLAICELSELQVLSVPRLGGTKEQKLATELEARLREEANG